MMRVILVVSVVGQLLLTSQGKIAMDEVRRGEAQPREMKPPAEIPREFSRHEEVAQPRERKPPAPRRELPREFHRHVEATPQMEIKPRVDPESFQPDPVEERVPTGMKPSGGHGEGGGGRGGGGRPVVQPHERPPVFHRHTKASRCSTPSAITVAANSNTAGSFGTIGRHYDNYMKCGWKIQAPGNQKLRLHFNRFNLEQGNSHCPYDYVKVYNGPDTNANLVGKFCGPTVPGDIITTQSAAFVSFSSDYSVTRSGFNIRYSRVSCKTLSYVYGTSGTFGTVGSYYGNYERCSWRIRVPQHKRVLLQFKRFNLEYGSASCPYDRVKIFDGSSALSTLKGKYCGTNVPSNFVSSSNVVFVSFTSDVSVVRPGFTIQYSIVSCMPLTVLTQPQGEFGTDGSPYGNYEKCSWKIQISGTNKRIRLHFTSFHLENGGSSCPYDYVAIYNGGSATAPLKRKVCGPNRPGDIVITGNTAFVKFLTDYSVTKPGFRIRYSVVGRSCTTPSVLTGVMGSFGTSRSPYDNNEMCSWKIQVASGKRVYLHCFHFDLELGNSGCPYDYVKVYDGSSSSAPLKGKFCGKHGPVALHSSGNTMFVTFKTDSSVTKAGFRCMYMGDSATRFGGAPGGGGGRVVGRRDYDRRESGGGGRVERRRELRRMVRVR